ncbi:helix-turn-helix domain-containing protein [bacterium]|nr:helix-turn-helix domain-containing protein [bacterium]
MVPKFRTIEVRPQETLGEKLKKIREEQKISYDEVEKKTKIRKKYIKAIESNSFSELPSGVYAKGFVKNYAKLLNLSEDKVLELFEKERGIARNLKEAQKHNKSVKLKTPKLVITPKILIIIGILISSIAVASYIVYEIFILTSPPRLEIISPKDNETITQSFIDIQGKTYSGMYIYINGQKVNTSEDGDFKVNVSLGKGGINAIKVVSRNPKNGKETEITKNIIADIKEVSIPTPVTVEEQKLLTLTLEIGPKASWIKIVRDGETVFEGLMLSGAKKTLEANDSFVVSTGNAGSTKFIFKGKDIGTLGKDGEQLNDLRFDKNTAIN